MTTSDGDRLNAAATLAAIGHHGAASTLLEAAPANGAASTRFNLLRAKIAAQLGRYDEATAHWQAVLAEDAGNAEARRGLDAASRVRGGRGWAPGPVALLALIAVATSIVLIGGAGAVAGLVARRAIAPIGDAVLAMEERQAGLVRDAARLQETAAAASHPVAAAVPGAANPAAIPIRDIAGVERTSSPSEQILTFPKGLFPSGSAAPSAEAIALLTAVGEALRPLGDSVEVVVEGRTDDVAPRGAGWFADNFSVGLARAAAVAGVLRRTGALTSSALVVRSTGEQDALFPNDGPDNRARNRTVVLRLRPRPTEGS